MLEANYTHKYLLNMIRSIDILNLSKDDKSNPLMKRVYKVEAKIQ